MFQACNFEPRTVVCIYIKLHLATILLEYPPLPQWHDTLQDGESVACSEVVFEVPFGMLFKKFEDGGTHARATIERIYEGESFGVVHQNPMAYAAMMAFEFCFYLSVPMVGIDKQEVGTTKFGFEVVFLDEAEGDAIVLGGLSDVAEVGMDVGIVGNEFFASRSKKGNAGTACFYAQNGDGFALRAIVHQNVEMRSDTLDVEAFGAFFYGFEKLLKMRWENDVHDL